MPPLSTPSPRFLTTRWSVILNAQRDSSLEAQRALEMFCRVYWYPLYAYLRRAGQAPHDAEDLTQEFFARLLEKDWLLAATPEKDESGPAALRKQLSSNLASRALSR